MRHSAMHAHLLSEIDGRAFRPLLGEITLNHPAYAAYRSWGAVAGKVCGGRPSEQEEDALVAPLLAIYASGEDERWGTVLCAVCFRWLVSMHLPRSWWMEGPEDVWQELVVLFLDTCRRLGVKGIESGVRRRLVSDTQRRLYDIAQRGRRAAERIAGTEPAILASAVDPRMEPHAAELRMEFRERIQDLDERLRRHLDEGTIAAIDHAIVVGTRVLGRSLTEQAALLGIGAEAAKKRRQRAERAMREAEALCPV